MPRSAAHHEADTRRVIKGRSEEWLRGYIARHAVRILVADQELADTGKPRMLTKSSIEILKQLRHWAGMITGRQRPQLPDLEDA